MDGSNSRLAGWSALSLLGIVAWEASGWDLALARTLVQGGGFPLKNHWLLTTVLHETARYLGWLSILLLCLLTTWPAGPWRRLDVGRRVQLAASALCAAGLISLLKAASSTSCPWHLAGFGGVAHYVPHWSLAPVADGGPGRCFPAGHASTGFAFMGGFFAWRHDDSSLAGRWLAASMAAGLLLGGAQQLRGAHFLSHTLWTAWICWMTGWLTDVVFSRQEAPGEGGR